MFLFVVGVCLINGGEKALGNLTGAVFGVGALLAVIGILRWLDAPPPFKTVTRSSTWSGHRKTNISYHDTGRENEQISGTKWLRQRTKKTYVKNSGSRDPSHSICFGCDGSGQRSLDCRICNGSGFHTGKFHTCKGNGHFERSSQHCFGCQGTGQKLDKICRRCDGSGIFKQALSEECRSCGGSGQYIVGCRKCNGIRQYNVSCRRCNGTGQYIRY